MAFTRRVSIFLAAGFGAAALSTGLAWAGGPGGVVDETADDPFQALGSGYVNETMVGYVATGDTEDEAEAAVVAACEQGGAIECTADVASNDKVCLVTVGDSATGVVSGGAGPTIEAAHADALVHATDFDTALDPNAPNLASACWND